MSTAQLVPETWELDGDDARAVLREAKLRRLFVDSVRRFRVADGFSHARSLAFAGVLTLIPGIIAVVGLTTVADVGSLRKGITDLIGEVAPGPSGQLLTDAIQQGATTSSDNGVLPLVLGLIAMAISGVTVFGQIERGANRIYGVEQDRPFREKYGRATLLFAFSFLIGSTALFAIGALRVVDIEGPWVLGTSVRALVGFAAGAFGFAVVFRRSPRRHQPDVSWLLVGSSISTALFVVATVALGIFWRVSSTFGETYGQLAGVMALALWSYLIAIGLLLGLAFAAQLEAVRGGRVAPQDMTKVAQSEPDRPITSAGPVPVGT